jgi:hypothetical protein
MKIQVAIVALLFIYYATVGAIVTMAFPGLDQVSRILNLLGDLTMIVLAAFAIPAAARYHARKAILLFLLGAAFTVVYNLDRVDLVTNLNGIREPLFFLAALIVFHNIFTSDFAETLERRFAVMLFLFALIQTPLVIMQFRAYGAGDQVGGSLGLVGGSGILTQILFLVVFYLVVRHGSTYEGEGFNLRKVAAFALLLAPIAMNETKIAFVFLFVFVLMLLDRRRALQTAAILGLGVGLLVLLNFYYSQNVQDTSKLFEGDFFERYLFYDRRESVDVPRFQKLLMMFDMMASDPWTYFTGFGYGLFLGRTFTDVSKFSQALYPFMGTRTLLNTLWMQGGLIAVVLYAFAMFRFLRAGYDRSRNMRRVAWFLAFILGTMWLYNGAVLSRMFALVAAYMIVWVEQGGIDNDDEDGVEDADRRSDEHLARTTVS